MLSLWVATVLAQAPKLVAPPWAAVDVSSEKAAFFSTHFAGALRERGVTLITAEDIAVMLGAERQRQLLGCSDDASSCMVELGAALGAELLLAGSIAKLDSTYVVSLRVVKSADGKVVAQEQARAGAQDALLDALSSAASSLASQLNPAAPPKRLGRKWALVPAIAGGAALVFGAVSYGVALIKLDELTQMTSGTGRPVSVLLPTVEAGETFERLAWVGFGVAGAAGVTALLMYLLGEPPPVALAIGPGTLGLSLGAAF